MNAFDVRIHTIRRRKNKRRPFEVRWRVAGRDKSKSFLTRALADSYRAELVRAARQGLEFDPATGEPPWWAVPEPALTTWLEHAVAYADMKWPRLAPHSRQPGRRAGHRHLGAHQASLRAAAGRHATRRQHLRKYGTAPNGRLFRGARGGILSESTYGRIWHAAREIALGPQLAATSLARRPYDLRHAALSLWLNATGAPAEVAARAGNSVHVLQDVYAHCTNGREDLISQQIEDALDPDSGTPHVSECVTASGYTHRWHRPDAVRHMSVNDPERHRRGSQLFGRALPLRPRRRLRRLPFSQLRRHLHPHCAATGTAQIWPTYGPQDTTDGLRNRSLCTQEPVTQDYVTGFDLRKRVAGVGFEPT